MERSPLATVFVGAVNRALNDDRVEVGEHFVFLEHHGACPGAVVDCEVENPLVRSSLAHIVQKLLKILLVLQHVLVKVGHLRHTHDFTAFLQEDGDSDVFCEGQQSVEVT